MKIRYNKEDQEHKDEIERKSPSEVEPLSNNEIPEIPDESHEQQEHLTNDKGSIQY